MFSATVMCRVSACFEKPSASALGWRDVVALLAADIKLAGGDVLSPAILSAGDFRNPTTDKDDKFTVFDIKINAVNISIFQTTYEYAPRRHRTYLSAPIHDSLLLFIGRVLVNSLQTSRLRIGFIHRIVHRDT